MDTSELEARIIWQKNFGYCDRATDFAGRTIAKNYYRDYKSEYGWVVTTILPVEVGGFSIKDNKICCHILTAREKQSRYPVFRANGKSFEIVYNSDKWILSKRVSTGKITDDDLYDVDFLDAVAGARLYKALKMNQSQPRFVGTILIRLKNMKNTALLNFIEKYFETEDVSFLLDEDYEKSETRIIARDYHLPFQQDTQLLLDKCKVLNAYMSAYFCEMGYVDAYDIYYRCDYYEEKSVMYFRSKDITPDKFMQTIENPDKFSNSLFVSQNVVKNTSAGEKLAVIEGREYSAYNEMDSKLLETLSKEAKRKHRLK